MDEHNLDPSLEYIKIHGLQRSGTNYLSYLINENFENTKVLVNLGGWKHGHYMAPWSVGKEVHVVVIVKNPYSWLTSVYDYWGTSRRLRIGPDLTGVPFEDFVQNRIYVEAQKDIPYLFRASNPVQHWNNMNFHWTTIRLNSKSLFVVTYESLLSNQEQCLQQISKSFGLTRKPKLESCDNVVLPSDEEIHIGDKKWDKERFYKNEQFMDMYSPETLKFVNDQLDLDLMIGLGYEYKGV
jgi:hypothetical protein